MSGLLGHWEIPPGEGYVWVADPTRPSAFSRPSHRSSWTMKKYEGRIAVSLVPSKSTAVACDSIDKVALGNAYGSSESDLLDDHPGSVPMKLADGAIPVVIENGSITLVSQPEVVHEWMRNFAWGFWVVNREGQTKPLTVDRCRALRPAYSIMTPAEQMSFNAQCPVAPPPGAPPR